MTTITIASELNDKALRADWPKMSDIAYEHAVKLGAFVARAMLPEPEDENAKGSKQYYVSFAALRRALPRSILLDVSIVGPKSMDFMSVITEITGLGVVQTHSGFWFFDLRGRHSDNGGYPHREMAKHFAALTPETEIPQYSSDAEDGDDGDW